MTINSTDNKICRRCILDTTVPDIQFDVQGICNYCRQYETRTCIALRYNEEGQNELRSLVEMMKRTGNNRPYDCVIGVSGGVDSTYVAYLVKKEFGLRPLAVHLDNGWDAELAVNNIENVLKKLDIDLYTKVLDWEEFKDLQIAFLRSSIANAEIPTDHAISATLYKIAARERIPYIISGSNMVSEAIMPGSWMHDSWDSRLIQAIQRRFGTRKLEDFPLINFWDWVYFRTVMGIKEVKILNYASYIKADAKKLLEETLGWRDYGGKHFESIYTRFFQSYYLPTKFNIDKRKAHLSTLIMSGQISRGEALLEIANPPCSASQMEEDCEYVIKKLGLGYDEFSQIMMSEPKAALDYPNDSFLWNAKTSVMKPIRYMKQIATKSRSGI